MEWTRKHQNLTSASDNAIFRSSAEQGRTILACEKKSNASEGCKSEGFNFAVKRENVARKVAKETSQEAQKRLKAQRQWGVSRRQCQAAEQTARRLLDQSEGAMKMI